MQIAIFYETMPNNIVTFPPWQVVIDNSRFPTFVYFLIYCILIMIRD